MSIVVPRAVRAGVGLHSGEHAMAKPKTAATANRRVAKVRFDQGIDPVITCVNRSTNKELRAGFRHIVAALQRFLDDCFVPVWGTTAHLKIAARPKRGTWTLVFLDHADPDDDQGYHELTLHNLPLSRVFVTTTIRQGDKVSVTACHELCEMLVDPAINLWADNGRSTSYAYEVCDPVEEDEFDVDGVLMSNFVLPAYFEAFRKPRSTKFDYLGLLKAPLTLRPGGYVTTNSRGKTRDRFGSPAKRKRFMAEDRRYHRSEFRKG
jgi:hypothetical protein